MRKEIWIALAIFIIVLIILLLTSPASTLICRPIKDESICNITGVCGWTATTTGIQSEYGCCPRIFNYRYCPVRYVD